MTFLILKLECNMFHKGRISVFFVHSSLPACYAVLSVNYDIRFNSVRTQGNLKASYSVLLKLFSKPHL